MHTNTTLVFLKFEIHFMRAEWKAAEKYEVPLCLRCLSQLGGRQKKGNGTTPFISLYEILESIYSFVLGGEFM